MFPSADKQMTAHIDDVNNHKEKRSVTTSLCYMLHGGEQLRAAFLNSSRTGGFYCADGKDRVLDGKFLEIGGNKRLSWLLVHVAGCGCKNSLPKLFNILSCNC